MKDKNNLGELIIDNSVSTLTKSLAMFGYYMENDDEFSQSYNSLLSMGFEDNNIERSKHLNSFLAGRISAHKEYKLLPSEGLK